MKSVSIIAAAAVMLASSVNAASNDPRECEGEFKFFETKIGFLYYCNNIWAVLVKKMCRLTIFTSVPTF